MIGRIPVFGEAGRAPIAKEFIEQLGGLAPTQRRLALARACALPWQNSHPGLRVNGNAELTVRDGLRRQAVTKVPFTLSSATGR